jgi:hypothetical protein
MVAGVDSRNPQGEDLHSAQRGRSAGHRAWRAPSLIRELRVGRQKDLNVQNFRGAQHDEKIANIAPRICEFGNFHGCCRFSPSPQSDGLGGTKRTQFIGPQLER